MNYLRTLFYGVQVHLFGAMVFKDRYGNRYRIPKDQRWLRTASKGVHTDDAGAIEIGRRLVAGISSEKSRVEVVDVGACVGVVSLSFGRLLRSTDRIHAIEPDRENYDALVANVALNKGLQVSIEMYNIAIANHDGTAILTRDRKNYGGHQIGSEIGAAGEEVGCATLSSFCERNRVEHIDLLKIDAEGYDSRILMSTRDYLAAGHVSSIVMECHRTPELIDAERMLRSSGFDIYYIVRDRPELHSSYEDWTRFSSRPPLNSLAIRKQYRQLLHRGEILVQGPDID